MYFLIKRLVTWSINHVFARTRYSFFSSGRWPRFLPYRVVLFHPAKFPDWDIFSGHLVPGKIRPKIDDRMSIFFAVIGLKKSGQHWPGRIIKHGDLAAKSSFWPRFRVKKKHWNLTLSYVVNFIWKIKVKTKDVTKLTIRCWLFHQPHLYWWISHTGKFIARAPLLLCHLISTFFSQTGWNARKPRFSS